MRNTRFVVVLVAVSVLAGACREIPREPFHMGWYTGVYHDDPSGGIVDVGGSRALYYHHGYLTDEKVQSRLEQASASGLEVIMHVDGITQDGSDLVAVDTQRVQEFVSTFKDHPAVVGWYTADEPSGWAQKALCQLAYDAVKSVDPTKPVYVCIDHSHNTTIGIFAPAYDILIFDSYVFDQGEREFYRLEDHGRLWWRVEGLKKRLADVAIRAGRAERPWVFAAQGFGRASDYGTRLPTLREHRFQTYFAFLKGASGALAWEYYTALDSAANPADAYPHAGTEWMTDVYQSLAEEIAILGAALGEEPDRENVSDSSFAVHSSLHLDPDDGTYYLLALNESESDLETTFEISLPGLWIEAVPLNGSGPIPLSENRFTDGLGRYDVIVYELISSRLAGG